MTSSERLQVTLPQEDVDAIDAAVERFDTLEDREEFIFMAVRFALASLREEADNLGARAEALRQFDGQTE